ncbi:hypothetical protein [Aurantiacibacter sediminis]|uniref:Virulence factor SrfB-like protein n=1 Tax=Aurantiacibacter sediminis TaxID=2793064 RepID=A0ABS0N669_9SPHN|nr:hypothetical protein [Aurantiacibacter sediminis]MBH5323304.1 hypothetical protein [Aurantiacibacter sediminis]
MAHYYNLPKLNFEDYPPATASGVWMKSGALNDMASSLELSNDDVEIDGLKSLPDPWARPLLFNQALTTKGHIAKADARDQWRGLLALLALRHFYTNTFILRVQTIDLDQTGVGNAKFRSVLRRLAPKDTLNQNLDWTRTGVITIRTTGEDEFDVGETNAIGLMVPNCLVAPARGARNLQMEGVPWLRDGLRDPCNYNDIPQEQWVALYAYLINIFKALDGPNISHKAHEIRTEIGDFGKACKEKIDGSARAFAGNYEGFSEDLPYPFYEVLGSAPAPGDEVEGAISECELKVLPDNGVFARSDDEQGKLRGLILIDPDIAKKTLQKAPQDVRLYSKYMLGTVDQGGNRDALQRDAERDGYMVITPDQLFTEKLVKLANDGPVEEHGPRWENFTLPISPLVLFLISRDRISHQLSIDDRGDAFEVRLTLDLIPSDSSSRAPIHTISKLYDKQTMVAEESVPDDIILWPDVGMKNWPWNFMRYSFNSDYEMAPRFAASMQSLADTVALRSKNRRTEAMALLMSLGSNDDLVFERMEQFFQGNSGELKGQDGKLIAHRFRFTDIEDAIGEQHILGQGADYLFFGMKPDDGGDIMPAGCILLPERRSAQGPGTMDIAVDFGTTNTVVYFKSGSKTERMVFKPRVSRPIHSRLADEDQFHYDCVPFFPATEVISPFPTVMYRRSFDLRGGNSSGDVGNSNYHGITDNIFFMPEVADKFSYAVEREEKKELAFDLKWSKDPEIKWMVRRFIRQIIMMSTVEAMAREVMPEKIKWHFSYPQAWSSRDANVFQEAVKLAWTGIMEPVIGKKPNIKDYVDFETEGAAALRFFVDGPEHVGKAGRLITMFDIGGGTTEIAIYHREETIWRSSFKIAGGDFFTQFLSQNIAVFDEFRSSASSMRDVLERFGQNASLKHFVELYISQPDFNDTFADSYPMFSDEPQGVGLTNTATLALAGLFYYTGLVLRSLKSKGLLNDSDINSLTLAFAGRGSSFFSHFGRAEDEYSLLGQLARMITDVVHAEPAEGEENARITEPSDPRVGDLFSTHPKHEVAHGMLCGTRADRKRHARNTATPLGEAVILSNGEQKTFGSDFAVEDLPEGLRLDDVTDHEFDRFLDLLAKRTGLKIKIDSKNGAARNDIRNSVDREFSRALAALEQSGDDETGETQEIEPPFISKLRMLVHMLARNVDERQNLLTVQNEDPKW